MTTFSVPESPRKTIPPRACAQLPRCFRKESCSQERQFDFLSAGFLNRNRASHVGLSLLEQLHSWGFIPRDAPHRIHAVTRGAAAAAASCSATRIHLFSTALRHWSGAAAPCRQHSSSPFPLLGDVSAVALSLSLTHGVRAKNGAFNAPSDLPCAINNWRRVVRRTAAPPAPPQTSLFTCKFSPDHGHSLTRRRTLRRKVCHRQHSHSRCF